ncbi:hypothetical protein BN1708_018638, partial [Verticillium longisporum]
DAGRRARQRAGRRPGAAGAPRTIRRQRDVGCLDPGTRRAACAAALQPRRRGILPALSRDLVRPKPRPHQARAAADARHQEARHGLCATRRRRLPRVHGDACLRCLGPVARGAGRAVLGHEKPQHPC